MRLLLLLLHLLFLCNIWTYFRHQKKNNTYVRINSLRCTVETTAHIEQCNLSEVTEFGAIQYDACGVIGFCLNLDGVGEPNWKCAGRTVGFEARIPFSDNDAISFQFNANLTGIEADKERSYQIRTKRLNPVRRGYDGVGDLPDTPLRHWKIHTAQSQQ